MPFRVRPARPEDRSAIAAFTAETFVWGDYVSESFDRWLDDADGLVLVAVDDDDIAVAVSRTVLLSEHEAWLHAARVHPAHRRRGLGSMMNEAGCRWARSRGAVVARLLVEDWNEPARGQVTRLGYRPVAPWTSAFLDIGSEVLPTTNGGRRVPGEERLAPARATEADIAWMSWVAGDLARTGRELYPLGWHFRRMRRADLDGAARSRELWQCPSGWVVAIEHAGTLTIPWVSTTDLDAARLVRAIVDLGDGIRAERIHLLIPGVGWMVEALHRAGFEQEPSTVYATNLDG
jgi:GNAT superfamily N-acetyltransferase